MGKQGVELCLQVFFNRYQAGSIVVTTNRALRNCKIILSNDNTLAPAMIDRLVHRRWLVQTKGASSGINIRRSKAGKPYAFYAAIRRGGIFPLYFPDSFSLPLCPPSHFPIVGGYPKSVITGAIAVGGNTLGGFLMTALQKIPKVDAIVEIEEKRFKIVEMVGRRILKVKMERLLHRMATHVYRKREHTMIIMPLVLLWKRHARRDLLY